MVKKDQVIGRIKKILSRLLERDVTLVVRDGTIKYKISNQKFFYVSPSVTIIYTTERDMLHIDTEDDVQDPYQAALMAVEYVRKDIRSMVPED